MFAARVHDDTGAVIRFSLLGESEGNWVGQEVNVAAVGRRHNSRGFVTLWLNGNGLSRPSREARERALSMALVGGPAGLGLLGCWAAGLLGCWGHDARIRDECEGGANKSASFRCQNPRRIAPSCAPQIADSRLRLTRKEGRRGRSLKSRRRSDSCTILHAPSPQNIAICDLQSATTQRIALHRTPAWLWEYGPLGPPSLDRY